MYKCHRHSATVLAHPLLGTQSTLRRSQLLSCLRRFLHLRMFSLLFFAALCASCLAKPGLVHYSYSRAVGGGSGESFSSEGEGRITAVRVWEISSSYITGSVSLDSCQCVLKTEGLTLFFSCTEVPPVLTGVPSVTDSYCLISGKYHTDYIHMLIFVTSQGRTLNVGQPVQSSFNFYPVHPDAELRLLSGRYNGNGITSLGAYWGVVFMEQSNGTSVGK
ncbi:zymogen granule membrane protein 16-like [Odontesthes bonariensis]